MKRLASIVAVIALFAVGASFAQWNLPTDSKGNPIHPADAPCNPFSIGSSTAANTQVVVRSVPGYLSWIKYSTSTQQDFIILRDTGSINNTSIAPYYLTLGTADARAWQYDFSPPMAFSNGLTFERNTVTVQAFGCTRPKNTQTP